MKSLAQLQKMHADLKSVTDKAKRARDQFTEKTKALVDQKQFSTQHIEAETAKLRQIAVQESSKFMHDANSLVGVLRQELPFWKSQPFILSQQRFDADDDRDHAARQRLQERLLFAPVSQLKMEFSSAVDAHNLAAAYSVWCINETRRDQLGYKALDLASLEIPQQTQALAFISDGFAAHASAESAFVETVGQRKLDPLAVAHASTPQPIEPSTSFE